MRYNDPDQIVARKKAAERALSEQLAAQHRAALPKQPLVEKLHPVKTPMIQPGRGAKADGARQ